MRYRRIRRSAWVMLFAPWSAALAIFRRRGDSPIDAESLYREFGEAPDRQQREGYWHLTQVWLAFLILFSIVPIAVTMWVSSVGGFDGQFFQWLRAVPLVPALFVNSLWMFWSTRHAS